MGAVVSDAPDFQVKKGKSSLSPVGSKRTSVCWLRYCGSAGIAQNVLQQEK